MLILVFLESKFKFFKYLYLNKLKIKYLVLNDFCKIKFNELFIYLN